MSNMYGEWLKAQRDAAGLTQQELADAAIMTRSHIAHIEAGRRIPSKEDARRLDRALNTGNVLSSFLPQEDVAVADHFAAAMHLEQQARSIREFALAFVPGILQTEAYARAVLGSAFPPRSEEDCDRAVVTRLQRAAVLADPVQPTVWALLDESVLRRPVGGAAVMAGQLRHLVGLAESQRVRVHILPMRLGYHPLLQSMLSLMWFDDQPPVAYTEGMHIGRVHDAPAVVEQLQAHYDLALSDALPLRESIALMRAAAEEFDRHG
ncbi:helix-turn-helix domain-containing protein [Streptomyces zhihengii]|uniref:Helix-turn-helix transcriptional regulator n=1 Tax=Streptomyces zhihengii TaxID=1818004 RepID=A0ABS2UXP2_9ACTN|nr:helix-turn-helix transcriptional regulator [Streptomyces zhihengii]MBM9621465.1 helix-turn-helix transcriptional regulator [Streptomyces zhihengii]